jgi:uncharacterized protein
LSANLPDDERVRYLITLASAGLLLLAGCGDKASSSASNSPPVGANPLPVGLDGKPFTPVTKDAGGNPVPQHAQGTLASIRLWLGSAEVNAEMALTAEQDQTGMMFRTNMPEQNGMIFPLPYPQRAAFWMANCPLPLQAAYIDPTGQIVEIHDFHSFDTNSVLSTSINIYYVLEMNAGWFARHHIEPGTIITTEKGTLQAVFRGGR